MAGAEVVREYHAATTHGGGHDRSRLVRFQPLDPSNRPDPFKSYPGRSPAPLPREDMTPLARLLFLTAGVTRRSGTSWFRAAMSAGNLHPVEVYVVGRPEGLPAGVHHYHPLEHALTTVRALPVEGLHLVLTGIPFRTGWKYGERGWRHLYWDAGTMLANLLLVAPEAALHAGFVDAEVAALMGVDGESEFPLAVVTLEAGALPVAEPIAIETAPLAPRPIVFPFVREVQRAGDLASGAEVDAWRPDLDDFSALKADMRTGVQKSRDGEPADVILRRGSTRIMRHEVVPADRLTGPMAAAAAPVPGDWGSVVRHYLSVHAVDGVEPGAYRWEDAELRQRRATDEGDARAAAQHLCLDQPLGGDSAYTAFHAADLDDVLGRLGPRGYRAAHLEAGIAAGRLQLAATARGIGATGLTFYDDEVRDHFGTDDSCLLVTSVGVPDYRPRRGGEPGRPTELTGFEGLMLRLSRRLGRR